MVERVLTTLVEIAAEVADSLVDTFIGPAATLNKATKEKTIEIPRDNYAHADAQTEWWYYTGHLHSQAHDFGFEWVFFKRRTDKDRLGRVIPMRLISPINYYAHFAITDITAKQFRYSHRRAVNGSRPAGAMSDRYKIWLGDWSARESAGQHILSAQMNRTQLELALKPTKPIVKQGLEGLSYKEAEEASYYLSYTRMAAEGELIIGEQVYPVVGTAWMDHEFGSWTMKNKIQGWDWCAIQLADNRELMLFLIRDQNGQPTTYSEATLIAADGSIERFAYNQFSFSPIAEWRSPISNVVYPSGWKLTIPALAAELIIEPLLRCQELDTRGSTTIIYWEGAAQVSGTMATQAVSGRSYVELVGYDRSHEDLSLLDYFFHELRFRALGLH